jgi:hypothetical protein
MSMSNNTVKRRIEIARTILTPTQIGFGLLAIVLAGFLLMFVQEPLVHDAMHNGRHMAGVVCH